MKWNEVTRAVIGGAIEVHRALGPGLLESAYEACLEHELLQRGLRCARQKPLPVVYHGVRLDCGYRIDLLVEDVVLVELKAVSRILAIHQAQMMTYLKLSGLHIGLLLNFHVLRMRDGFHRYVRELPE
ncbi:MAG: GxxExxY protein [Sandaracinaceae bacterium]|nr:GxxExxY protein [Sandaracinaceae bacterium]